MKKLAIFTLAIAVAIIYTQGVGFAGHNDGPDDPPSGKHYNLNIIGFAQCDQNYDDDCYKGKGDLNTHGHTIFVPLKTKTDSCLYTNTGEPEDVTTTTLEGGVRILVTDNDGSELRVTDRDATDGLGRFNLPDGSYWVYARPLGKFGGCMDIDTIICEDDGGNQVDCDPDIYKNYKHVLVGHLDVKRTRGEKPKWTNATSQLLNELTGVGHGPPGYFDFFWQIYNTNLRLLQLRFYVAPPA
jgi:hypothetical protein